MKKPTLKSALLKFLFLIFTIMNIAGIFLVSNLFTLQQIFGVHISNLLISHSITPEILGATFMLIGSGSLFVGLGSIIKEFHLYVNVIVDQNPFEPGAASEAEKKKVRKIKLIHGVRVMLVLAGLYSIYGYLKGSPSSLALPIFGGTSFTLGLILEKLGRMLIDAISVLRNIDFLKKKTPK